MRRFLHGDQVVELSVLLRVQEREEKGEDGEGQIEVEGEKRLKERRTHMDDYGDEVRLKNTLSHEVHETRRQRVWQGARFRSCSGDVHFARVHVHVIALVVGVVCLMLVLSALVVVHAVFVQFL